jgi:hypothetical protein
MRQSIAELRIALAKGRAGTVDFRSIAARPLQQAGLRTGTDLDAILGPVGIPQGRLIEVFGGRSSGKTSVAFALLAACTNAGLLGAYIDPADAFFAPAAAGAGISLRRLLVVRPSSAEAARRAVDALVRCGACAVVVFDCAGLGDVLHAHHCARLAAQAEKTGTALLALSSGNIPALAYFASLRLRASGLAPLWQEGSDGGGRLAGCIASIDVLKSRTSAPGKSTDIRFVLPDVASTWPASGDRESPLDHGAAAPLTGVAANA